ncbi:FliH/SctL family protein [Bacillus thuringiensis]|nr:FliH/SctL family protein [Bacillus thuringiensis]
MSSYKNGSGNRIPRDSVTLSNELYRIKIEDVIGEEFLTNEEKEERVKKSDLQLKEEELRDYEEKLKEHEQKLQMELEKFETEKMELLERFRKEEEKYERKKRQEYYDIREFMWENAMKLSEEIVGQKIRTEDFSMPEMFKGLIKKLPIAFEELTITVHPETLECIKKDNSKESWMLENINWKLDYKLEIGEFMVEEENEYYDYRFSSIFNKIKGDIRNLNQQIRREGE